MSLSRDIADAYVTLARQGYATDTIAQAIAGFIGENNLFSLQDKILAQVKAFEDAERSYQTVHITAAHALGETLEKKIAHAVAGAEHAHVAVITEPALIAGYTARYRGVEWDASLKGSLERLRAALKR